MKKQINHKLVTKSIGQAIAKYRRRAKLTQEETAELLGIGNEAVSRIERGVVQPSITRLLEFAQIFDCSAADILLESSQQKKDQMDYLEKLFYQIKREEDRQLALWILEKLVERK